MSFLQTLNEYWAILMFLCGLVFHAIWTYFRVGNLETRISTLEDKTTTNTSDISEVKSKLESMDAKLDILVGGYKKTK